MLERNSRLMKMTVADTVVDGNHSERESPPRSQTRPPKGPDGATRRSCQSSSVAACRKAHQINRLVRVIWFLCRKGVETVMRGARHALRREVTKGVWFKCWGKFGKIERESKSAWLSEVVRALLMERSGGDRGHVLRELLEMRRTGAKRKYPLKFKSPISPG